jgi:hypothetical protein
MDVETLKTLMYHPVVTGAAKGAIAGASAAAAVDFQAFRSWKSADEAYNYAWKVAAWRWFQGAVLGAAMGAGFGAAG